MSKVKTESISVRIEADLKRELFEVLEQEEKTFSKWLRARIQEYLEEVEYE